MRVLCLRIDIFERAETLFEVDVRLMYLSVMIYFERNVFESKKFECYNVYKSYIMSEGKIFESYDIRI
jgi:hypothetical protein